MSEAELAIRNPEYCSHGVDTGVAVCHRCDGTAIYTEAQLQQEIAKARIDELQKHSEWIHWFGDKPCITIPLDEYNERIAELSQTLKEHKD